MERGCLLRGELTVGIDDRVHVPHPGDSICFESRKRHHMANKGPGMAVARRR
jgi:quercetin dioxygenase-like cupin family protein